MAEAVRMIVDMQEVAALTTCFPEASMTARQSRLTEGLLLLEREIKRLAPEGAGPIHLRDTIFTKVEMAGEKAWGMIGTPAVYGEPVEYGTLAHFPPVKPILFWVQRKLGLSGDEAKSAAFCIARAISKRGTKGAKMFGQGFEKNEAQVVAILNRIPEDIVRAVSA